MDDKASTRWYSDTRQGDATPLGEEFLLEDLNDTFNEVDELLERWDKRLSIKNLAFAKRYLQEGLEIGFHLHVGRQAGSVSCFGAPTRCACIARPTEYVAIFHRKPRLTHGDSSRDLKRLVAPEGDHRAHLVGLVNCSDRHQQPVLVYDADVVETIEGRVSSLVRLEPAENFDRSRAGTREGGKISSVRTYWEFGVLGGRATIGKNEGICETIQGGTEIMDAIPEDGSPLCGDVFDYLKIIRTLSSLRIYIDDAQIRVTPLKGLDLGVEFVKVFFGPVDLYPDALQS